MHCSIRQKRCIDRGRAREAGKKQKTEIEKQKTHKTVSHKKKKKWKHLDRVKGKRKKDPLRAVKIKPAK